MTKRFIHLLHHARLSLATGALLAWIMLLTLHSCTRTVAGSGQDSTYFARLSFVIENNATFTDYYSALQQTGYFDTLAAPGPYTVLLPDNDGYSNPGKPLLATYVAYDILRGKFALRQLPLEDNQPLPSLMGGSVYISRYLSGTDTITTVNGLQVISPDNAASNGFINVIAAGTPKAQIYPTVLQTLQSDTNFAAFVTAVYRAHLDTLLSGKGPFTILAPYNNAFPPVDTILVADPVKLSQLIKYHIIPGRYFLNDFLRRQGTDTLRLPTLNGETLGFFTQSPVPLEFYANGNVQSGYPQAADCYPPYDTDLPAGNGVVHIIDRVLNP